MGQKKAARTMTQEVTFVYTYGGTDAYESIVRTLSCFSDRSKAGRVDETAL